MKHLEILKKWEAKWIISWKLDRLTRNPVDTWTIQFMLQNWTINKIISNDREYSALDAWLLFSVETWMSNQFILTDKLQVPQKSFDEKPKTKHLVVSINDYGFIGFRDFETNEVIFELFTNEIELLYQASKIERKLTIEDKKLWYLVLTASTLI